MDEPTPYRLRVSRRTRRMHLVVSASAGLTVVVPPRFDRSRIAPLLDARRDWIEQAQRRVEAERHHLDASRAAGVPCQLLLQGIGEAWDVEYHPSPPQRLQARVAGATLTLSGPVGDGDLVGAALNRFVARRAAGALEAELRLLAAARGLTINGVAVRAQRTRWGSCSARGSINLNRNLAFLPRRLVRHVLLHELCHLVELNHSPAFWRLLDAEEPDRRALDRELRAAWRFIPHWARN